MACYFDITDEHKQALALAKYLGQRKDDNSIEGTISGYLTNNQLHEATQLFIDNSAAILADNNARHVQSYFALLTTLMIKAGDKPEQRASLVKALTTYDTLDSDQAQTRASVLVHLSNIAGEALWKADLLAGLLALAAKTGQLNDIVSVLLDKIESVLSTLDIPIAKKREIFLLSSSLLPEDPEETAKFLIHYLESFSNAEEVNVEANTTQICQVVSTLVNAPLFYKFDLIALTVGIASLPENHVLKKLVLLLADLKSVTDFSTFAAGNGGALATHNINVADLERKVKISAVAALACTSSKLTYAQVAAEIQVPESEVEEWIICAISDSLLDAKLDQVAEVVTVNNAYQKTFTLDQWKGLGSRVAAWKENIAGMIKVVHRANEGK